MLSYTFLRSLLLWTLLSLVSTKPTEISSIEYEEEEYEPETFNSTDDTIILQARSGPFSENGKTYIVYFMDVNWFTAAVHCRYYGMYLASVTSPNDNLLLQRTLHQFGKYFTISVKWNPSK